MSKLTHGKFSIKTLNPILKVELWLIDWPIFVVLRSVLLIEKEKVGQLGGKVIEISPQEVKWLNFLIFL